MPAYLYYSGQRVMSADALGKVNALKEGTSLFKDDLIFNDDVITGLWVRYHKLYVLLGRSALIMRLESIRIF